MSYNSKANYDCPKYFGVIQALLYKGFQRQELHSQLHGCWALSAVQLQYAALPVTSLNMRYDTTSLCESYSLPMCWLVNTTEYVASLLLCILLRLSMCTYVLVLALHWTRAYTAG